MADLLIRFAAGGLIVSAFAIIGNLFKPKTFAGLFGAAPSVALATLTLTVMKQGSSYASLEARSMIVGAFALCLYAVVSGVLIARAKMPALAGTLAALPIWFLVSFGVWWGALRWL